MPEVFGLAPWAGKPLMPKPVLSLAVTSDDPVPALKVVVVMFTEAIEPLPMDGIVVPVLLLASGGTELKFHWVMIL
jgi:hypothetical protein